MKSKPGHASQVYSFARWSISLAAALFCMTAMGWFARPGGSSGHTAPAVRLGMVRLEGKGAAPDSTPAKKLRQARRQPWLPAADVGPSGAPAPAQDSTPREQPTFSATAAAANAVAAMEAYKQSANNDSPVAKTQPRARGKQDSQSAAEPSQPAPAHPLGRREITEPRETAKTGPYVYASDAPRPSTGETRQEMEADRLDAGFGLLRPVRPAYPPLARRLGKAGRVRLELAIDPDGRVYRISVLEETGGWGFGPSAASAYQNARFTPPTVQGRRVRVLWRKTVIFRP